VSSLAEPPERKALKNLLIKLKAKSLESENRYTESSKDLGQFIGEIYSKVRDLLQKHPEDENLKDFQTIWISLSALMGLHAKQVASTVEDLKLYIEALEDSYRQLDDTFEKAVYEPARKQAEAKIKEQEELNKRTKPDSYRV